MAPLDHLDCLMITPSTQLYNPGVFLPLRISFHTLLFLLHCRPPLDLLLTQKWLSLIFAVSLLLSISSHFGLGPLWESALKSSFLMFYLLHRWLVSPISIPKISQLYWSLLSPTLPLFCHSNHLPSLVPIYQSYTHFMFTQLVLQEKKMVLKLFSQLTYLLLLV